MRSTRLFFLIPFLVAASLHGHPDPAHTLAELERHLSDAPADPLLWFRKAELLLNTGHPEEARPAIEEGLKLAPENPPLLLLRARLLERSENTADALVQVEEITRRFPDFGAGWTHLARLYHQTNQADQAIRAKLRHLAVDDHAGPGDYLTAATWLKTRSGSGDIEAAIAVLDDAISRFGTLTGIQQTAIQLESSLGRYDAALSRVDLLVASNRPSVRFSLMRAQILESAGRYQEAAAACDSAVALLQLGNMDPADRAMIERKILARKAANLEPRQNR